jgi:hypothetical protein
MIGPQAGFPDARTVAEWFKHQRVKYALGPGRRVYSHALPCNDLEASGPAGAIRPMQRPPTHYAGAIRTWRSTPTLHHSPRPDSRTRTRTSAFLYQSPFTFHQASLRYHLRRGLSLKTQLGRFEGVFLGHSGFSSVEAVKD